VKVFRRAVASLGKHKIRYDAMRESPGAKILMFLLVTNFNGDSHGQ
jgi:hypothetical protein